MTGADPNRPGDRRTDQRPGRADGLTGPIPSPETERLRRRALRLAWFIVIWDVLEGVVAITAGIVANSIALVAFGIDSAIEVFAAGVVIWHLRKGPTERQARALRLLAGTFAVLAVYITFEAVRDLLLTQEASESPIGIALNAVALVVMVPIAIVQRQIGDRLDNEVLVAQSRETWISNALSVSVLTGLGLNALFGWWQADPIAALLIAVVAAWSAREAWHEARERQTPEGVPMNKARRRTHDAASSNPHTSGDTP